MTVRVMNIISQVELGNGRLISKSSGKTYDIREFISIVKAAYKLTKEEVNELETYFCEYVKPQTQKSIYIENIIKKYNFEFSDGVYFVNKNIMTLDEIYRLFWKHEKLLPTETDEIIENVEKISEPKYLQVEIFNKIKNKAIKGESLYLKSLKELYPKIEWTKLLYNIIVPNTKPMFHIFYDDGIGGTGKSTLLEVLTKIVGEKYVSNVLLDQFGNRFIFANMMGKYLNIGDDNGKNDELQNVGTLKSIITGGRVTIDRKNIAPIEVRIFAKQLFATNILPYIDFTDGGIMRRLNIVLMNKVIPKNMVLPKLDDEEIGRIIYAVLGSFDVDTNCNSLAITNSTLYRFYKTEKIKDYNSYISFCTRYGFRTMNIINFETKSKFIKAYIEENEAIPAKYQVTTEDIF